jgi:hypothetical protein
MTIREMLPATRVVWAMTVAAAALPANAQTPTPPPAAQNPSPMVERSRAHVRLAQVSVPGMQRTFEGPLGKPVEVFVPAAAQRATVMHLVVTFHGAAFVPEMAVSKLGGDYTVAAMTLGAGSGVYDRAFTEPAVFDTLLATIRREVAAGLGHPVRFADITLVGFSAGHGAVRAILRDSAHYHDVGSVLLLDGLHTSYVPEGTIVEKGGVLDSTNLEVFVRFARAAVRGEKRFVITHSEIFPGTFASTTETTDFLIAALGLKRTPVLKWGPGGMQQLSEVKAGRLDIMGFAGNAGPDHIDHFQGLPEFLRQTRSLRVLER